MADNLINKICLGTVQFGMNYGIANTTGQIPKDEAFQILEYAYAKGMRFLDTAHAYGNSEKIIGEFAENKKAAFNIISKISLADNISEEEIEPIFLQSLERLRVKKLYAYLIHSFDDFRRDNIIWDKLKILKERHLIEKIGLSIYRPQELEVLLDNAGGLDIIQVPYSIFDRRFEEYFSLLRKRNIEICVRSVFLQGLAFMDRDKLPHNLSGARNSLLLLKEISKENNISLNALCINFVLLNPLIDRIIIGVDGLGHLKANIEDMYLRERVRMLEPILKGLVIKDENILLPYMWGG